MFPLSNNPFTYTFEGSFGNDENPSISILDQEHTPSSFLHFPSPFPGNDNELLENHLFSQQQLLATTDQTAEVQINPLEPPPPPELVSKKRSTSGGKKQSQARKRAPGKKDRHSKIYTAQGPRDRRMRLSLQIARKFFDLQDMLGFDKASKTIEWLFTKSKAAIKDLTGSHVPQVKRSCSVSEFEQGGMSNIIKETSNNDEDDKDDDNMGGKADTFAGVKIERKSRNLGFHPFSKEGRDKARARARERTREKIIRSHEKSNPTYLEQAATGSSKSSPIDVGEELSTPNQDINYSTRKTAASEVEEPAVTPLLEHQMATVGIIDNFFGTLTTPSILNDSYNIDFLDFQGNWSMENARIRSDYRAITYHMDPNSTGDVHQQQNPSSRFIIDSDLRSQSQFLGN